MIASVRWKMMRNHLVQGYPISRQVRVWWRLDIPSCLAVALQATDVIEKPKQEVKGDLEKENATWTRYSAYFLIDIGSRHFLLLFCCLCDL